VTAAVLEAPVAPSYDLLTDLAELRERTEAIAAEKKPFGFDVETGYLGDSREGAALHAEENFVVSIQFTNDPSWSRLVPLAFDSGPNVDNKAVAALFWALLHAVDDEALPLGVAHGAVAELRWMARWFLRNLWDHPLFGRQVREAHGYYPVRSCTMLESFSEGKNPSHGLKALTALPEPEGFGYKMRELTDLQMAMLGRPPTKEEEKSVRFNVFNSADLEVIAYACEDAVYALLHHLRRWPRVHRTFIYRVEMNVLPIVCSMSDVGVAYDWNLLRAKSAEVREFADRLLAEIIEDFEALAGEKLAPNFNFNSNKQFQDLLYVKCKMPVLHLTPGGAPSVDAKNALPGLAAQYPVVKKYMGWKRLHDLRLKFTESYEAKYSWAADGRAHPALLQHGTIAGRFSCESPNYQQSPSIYHFELRDGTVFDFNFRDAIVAAGPGSRPWWDLVLEEAGCTDTAPPEELGYYFIGFDYSQIELRVMAAEAGETALLEAFAAGEDVHKRTAALMLSIMVSQVTKFDRKVGKTRNFASIYGQGIGALADQLGISIEEAREKDQQYKAAHPHMGPYRAQVIARARRDGYVITKFGRRVTLHEIRSENKKVRAAEERTAGNAVIQGPATGEYVKVAMVRAVKALAAAGLADKVRLNMNIHDALEFEARKDVPPAVVMAVLQPAVVYAVNGPGAPWPEMVAEWHMGRSWGSVKEIEMLPDGTVRLKPEDEDDPAPAAVPEYPPEDEDVVPAACVPPVPEPPAGPPREVIIGLQDVPTRDQVAALAQYMRSLPGQNTVQLQMPDDTRVPVGFRCGLTPVHGPRVSAILGRSTMVHYGAVALAEIFAGLPV
jgi:DNA polymerase I-like protein with 3'-5' exonuclease and polymerase domains